MPQHWIFAKPADRRRIRRRAYPVYRDDTPRIAVTLVTITLLFYAAAWLFAPALVTAFRWIMKV